MPRAVQRLSLAVFLGCLIDAIEQGTGTKCYDSPENRASPLYSVELQNTQPENTKTMYIDAISVWVHCISEPVRPYSNANSGTTYVTVLVMAVPVVWIIR